MEDCEVGRLEPDAEDVSRLLLLFLLPLLLLLNPPKPPRLRLTSFLLGFEEDELPEDDFGGRD